MQRREDEICKRCKEEYKKKEIHNINIVKNVKCPYCSAKNIIPDDYYEGGPESEAIVECWNCNKEFIFYYTISHIYHVKKQN